MDNYFDRPVYFAENKITNTWIRKDFNIDDGLVGNFKTWVDTKIPIEAMKFSTREECFNFINNHDFDLVYTPTEYLFSI